MNILQLIKRASLSKALESYAEEQKKCRTEQEKKIIKEKMKELCKEISSEYER